MLASETAASGKSMAVALGGENGAGGRLVVAILDGWRAGMTPEGEQAFTGRFRAGEPLGSRWSFEVDSAVLDWLLGQAFLQ